MKWFEEDPEPCDTGEMAWSGASLFHRFEDVRVFSSRDLSSKELDELGEEDDDDEDEGSFELGQNAVPSTRSVH